MKRLLCTGKRIKCVWCSMIHAVDGIQLSTPVIGHGIDLGEATRAAIRDLREQVARAMGGTVEVGP